jgi:hypothetical protein
MVHIMISSVLQSHALAATGLWNASVTVDEHSVTPEQNRSRYVCVCVQ